MLNKLTTIVNSVFQAPATQVTAPVAERNPFANPFMSSRDTNQSEKSFYGKNKPVSGGYFAGYYNGKPNIVGQRLFVEV